MKMSVLVIVLERKEKTNPTSGFVTFRYMYLVISWHKYFVLVKTVP